MKHWVFNIALVASIVLLFATVTAVFLLDRPVILYRNGPPAKEELLAYAEAHRGAYPPLPNPLRATYLVADLQGLNLFRQSATTRITSHDQSYGGPTNYTVVCSEPGRFQMCYIPRLGLRTITQLEVIDLRTSGARGFVWRDTTTTAHGATFRCRQITVPWWFLIVCGAAPVTPLSVRGLVRAHRARLRDRLHSCVICGYDLRATPERCPECGTAPGKPQSTAPG